MVEIRSGDEITSLEWPEFEARVREGRVDPYAEVRFPPVTGDAFVPAWDLESFRSLYQVDEINFRRTFNLNRLPLVTILIILINLGLWHFMETAGGSQSVRVQVLFGAKVNSRIYELGEYWRLLSANFLHAGFWHLFVNMFVFFNLGGALENAFSRINYIRILFFSGLLASVTSFLLNPSVSVGASGMVFGTMGGAMVFGFKYRELLPPRYRRYFGWAVVPYLFFSFWLGVANSGIDNYAHLGGLLAGSVTTLLLPAELLDDRPPPGPLAMLRQTLPLAVLGLLLLFGGNGLAAVFPRLLPVEDKKAGIQFLAPDSWRQTPEFWGFTARGNGQEWVSGGSLPLDRPSSSLAEATELFRALYLDALERHGEVRHLEERDGGRQTLDGRDWQLLEVDWTYRRSRQRVDVRLHARGARLYVVFTGADALAYDDYRPLLERIGRSARLLEGPATR